MERTSICLVRMNKMNNKIKNIIFDMNGTMIFDGKYHEIAWKDYGLEQIPANMIERVDR